MRIRINNKIRTIGMKSISFLFIVVVGACTTNTKEIERPDTFNYKQGLEAMQDDDWKGATTYFNEEVKENPDNGYAWMWLAYACTKLKEYGQALTAADRAMKTIPKKDKKCRVAAYITRSEVYAGIGEKEKAIDDLTDALKEVPDNADIYEQRAELFLQKKDYKRAERDFRKIIDIDPGNVAGYMGMGRNAIKEGRYEDAIRQFDYVIKLEPEYASAYSFRAECYMMLEKGNEAIDDIIHALDIGTDKKAFLLMMRMIVDSDIAIAPLVAKLKRQSVKRPDDSYWANCLGIIYEYDGQYREAIRYYRKCLAMKRSDMSCSRIADCLDEMGDYAHALTYIDEAIRLDPAYNVYLMTKANIEGNLDRLKEAIADLDRYIANDPEEYYGYYRRGLFKERTGDRDGAIEDYTTAILLNPEFAYAYLNRGILWNLKRDTAAARADFERNIELDTVPDKGSSAQYAYFYTGQPDKAKRWMDMVLASCSDKDCSYDAACLYALMGEKEKAIGYLRTALEKGYRRFVPIERDRDMDNIRREPAFKELLETYRKKHEAEVEELAPEVEMPAPANEDPDEPVKKEKAIGIGLLSYSASP